MASYSPSLADGVRIAEESGSKLALQAIARFTGVPLAGVGVEVRSVATDADYARLDELVGG